MGCRAGSPQRVVPVASGTASRPEVVRGVSAPGQLRRGNSSKATECRFDRVVGAVGVDDPRRLIQNDLDNGTALDYDLVLQSITRFGRARPAELKRKACAGTEVPVEQSNFDRWLRLIHQSAGRHRLAPSGYIAVGICRTIEHEHELCEVGADRTP